MEPGARAADNLDSTARLMAEALAKASTELDKLVNAFCEHLSTFNKQLGRSFEDEARAAEERIDARLRQTTEALCRDREDLLKNLSRYKQAEIQAIIDKGKELRGLLAIRVDETAAEFSCTLVQKMNELQELLSGPQAEANTKSTQIEEEVAAIEQEMYAFLGAKLREKNEAVKSGLEFFEAEAREAVTQAVASTETRVQAALEKMRFMQHRFTSEMQEKEEHVPQSLDANMKGSLDALSLQQTNCLEKLTEVSLSGKSYAEEVSMSFDASMSDLSDLLTTLYDARLKNMLSQSRTEIMNSARKAKEGIAAARNDLHATLHELQRNYAEKLEELYAAFEKSVEDQSREGRTQLPRGARDGAREQLNALFRRLGQEMIDTAASAAGRVEGDFQRSVVTFEKRIESARDNACESLEREFKLMQKELSRAKQDFDKEIQKIQNEIQHIEKEGRDAADIVLTLRSATLEF